GLLLGKPDRKTALEKFCPLPTHENRRSCSNRFFPLGKSAADIGSLQPHIVRTNQSRPPIVAAKLWRKTNSQSAWFHCARGIREDKWWLQASKSERYEARSSF